MRLSPSDLRSLHVFRAVVEHHGFVGAQAALNMPQPAVSLHVKALEERVGFRLCRRGRSGFALTEKGALFYEGSKTLFAALAAFESGVGELRHEISGTLRLGLVDNTVTDPDLPLDDVLHDFLRKARQSRVEIVVGTPEVLVAELTNGGVDLAILPETAKVKGLNYSAFHHEDHSLYCGSRHPLASSPAEVSPQTAIAQRFVVRPYANLRELQHFPGAVIGAHASNMEAQAMFVLSGHFLGYLPDHFAARWVAEGRLIALMRESTWLRSAFFVVTRENEHRSVLLRTFVQELISKRLARLQSAGPAKSSRFHVRARKQTRTVPR